VFAASSDKNGRRKKCSTDFDAAASRPSFADVAPPAATARVVDGFREQTARWRRAVFEGVNPRVVTREPTQLVFILASDDRCQSVRYRRRDVRPESRLYHRTRTLRYNP
jgi:hypothetical protein